MASHMLKIMKEEATCSICLKLMTEPMIIDCGHSYCRMCIMDISESKSVALSQRTYSCPQCQAQSKTVSLRPNKQLQNLIEIIKEMDLEAVCEEHREELHLFCEDDGQLICWCCARSPQHKGHVTLLVGHARQVYKKKLQDTVEKLKELEDKCNDMKILTNKHITECKWKIENQKTKVQSDFTNLKNFLHEEEKSHLWKLEKEREKVLKRLQDGEASLEKQSRELQNHILQLEEKCQGSAEMLLRDVKDTLDRMSTVRLELPETISLSLDGACNVSELYFDVKKITNGYLGSSASASSHSSIPIPQSSGICPGLDKKPEGSWICDICLVQNNADCTKCVDCENARPGVHSECKGVGISFSSSNSASSVFKFGVSSSSAGPTQSVSNTRNFKFGDQGDFKVGVSPDSGPTKFMNKSFKFSESMGDFKFGIPSVSKPEEAKDNKSDDNFKSGLFDSLSNPASVTSFQFGVSNLGQQVKKEEPLKPSSAAFSIGVATANSTVTSGRKSKFSFGTPGIKKAATFTGKKSEAKKELPAAKAGFTFGNTETISLPSAPLFVSGRSGDKQKVPATSISQVFGKNIDNEKSKCQPLLNFGFFKQIKDESSSKPTFGTAKPLEKKTEQPMKATFAFGNQTNTTAGIPKRDQGATNPGFSFLSSNSSNSSTTAASAGSGIFGGSTTSSTVPTAGFLSGQASSTLSGFAFGNSAKPSTSQSSLFPQKSKPGPSFQFGSCQTISNFHAVCKNNPPELLTFGGNQRAPAASAQPSASGSFAFNQAPAAFTVGSNGKNIFSSGTSVSDRKTKTPVRHKK